MTLRTWLCLIFFLHYFLAAQEPVVLVTGGAGYIGSHTCKALKEAGFCPVTYDSLISGSKEAVKWGPLVIGDLNDVQKLERTFLEYKPVAVIHFAGLRGVGESVQDPCKWYLANIAGSIRLLEMLVAHNVKSIVFSSSSSVYGLNAADNLVVSETQPLSPTNPYAMSKYMVERMIKDCDLAYGIKHVNLRYFNAAGMDLESGLKPFHSAASLLIPKAIESILHPENPLQIFGTDYPTADGTAIRDYIHVKDLADAHVLALHYLLRGNQSETLNLGTGTGYSVFEVIHMVEEVTGKKVPTQMTARREGDIPRAVADPAKSRAILGFIAKHSDLRTIVETTFSAQAAEYQ